MEFFLIIAACVACYVFGYFMGLLFAKRSVDKNCKQLAEKFETLEQVMEREG